jgi:stage V sporulation protein B
MQKEAFSMQRSVNRLSTPVSASAPASSRSMLRPHLSPRKKAFLTSTLLLTSTGLICRVLGFFYRIYLSRAIGAEGLGIYQMVHPLFGICFALCAGSLQTALSQYVAACQPQGKKALLAALSLSMSLSLILAWGITALSQPLARYVLLEPRCAPYLPVIALSVPFCALHACINGYYYGMQKTKVPALSQVAEQAVRMGAVWLIAAVWAEKGRPVTAELAFYGHLVGEMASALFTLMCLGAFPPAKKQPSKGEQPAHSLHPSSHSSSHVFYSLLSLAVPLMGNRLVLNILGSAEAVWIPNRLMAYGLTDSQALSLYGVLTSMAMPFIFFPSAITNSMAVLLLPSAAEAQASGSTERISSMLAVSMRYSCYMGILCIGIFTLFGNTLGTSLFHDPQAGEFITILCWLCPFMYLATTLGSIQNGLGRTSSTFFQNIAAMVLRLAFVLFAIPRFGILGYLWGLLASELALALMCFFTLNRLAPVPWNVFSMVVKPVLFLFTAIGTDLALCALLPRLSSLPPFFSAALQTVFISLVYGGLLLLFHQRTDAR